jgi:hypothetical protein
VKSITVEEEKAQQTKKWRGIRFSHGRKEITRRTGIIDNVRVEEVKDQPQKRTENTEQNLGSLPQ